MLRTDTARGQRIRERRQELNLTIAEAAVKAGVGAKTWSRYESGGNIRRDKISKVCRTLKWESVSGMEDGENHTVEEYKMHQFWPKELAENLGDLAGVSFVIGSELLFDQATEDLEELTKLPRGSHLGQLEASWLVDMLPKQFVPLYDYNIVYRIKTRIRDFQNLAKWNAEIAAHTVFDELILYMIMEASEFLMSDMVLKLTHSENSDDDEDSVDSWEENWESWAFDLFDDMDIITFLYSNLYLPQEHAYHFDNWFVPQFWLESSKEA